MTDEFLDDDGAVIPYGRRWSGSPPDDAYGRVSHPERFAPIETAARALVEQLPRAYEVSVEPADATRFEHPDRIVETFGVYPSGGGGELLIAITDFPGVMIRTASGGETAFPPCGCDACDEDVVDQIDSLQRDVADAAMDWPLR